MTPTEAATNENVRSWISELRSKTQATRKETKSLRQQASELREQTDSSLEKASELSKQNRTSLLSLLDSLSPGKDPEPVAAERVGAEAHERSLFMPPSRPFSRRQASQGEFLAD